MLLAVEGVPWHSDGFETVAAAHHESAQEEWVEFAQGDAWIFHHRDPATTCGCHGDDFMAEGSDALVDRLYRVMTDELPRGNQVQ